MKFWSEEFFSAAADTVNSDPRVAQSIAGIRTTILAECTDRSPSFLIRVDGGRVAVSPAPEGEASEFVFSAPYDEWTGIIRDSLNIRGEVLRGKVKFRGSMPKMLLYLGRVSRIENELTQKMRSMGPEF